MCQNKAGFLENLMLLIVLACKRDSNVAIVNTEECDFVKYIFVMAWNIEFCQQDPCQNSWEHLM